MLSVLELANHLTQTGLEPLQGLPIQALHPWAQRSTRAGGRNVKILARFQEVLTDR
jgi:hypothetical protein